MLSIVLGQSYDDNQTLFYPQGICSIVEKNQLCNKWQLYQVANAMWDISTKGLGGSEENNIRAVTKRISNKYQAKEGIGSRKEDLPGCLTSKDSFWLCISKHINIINSFH